MSTPTTAVIPPPVSEAEVAQKPWRYIGYAAFARFIALDNDFLFFRRFDRTSVRVLLAMQDRVSQLEETLDRLDAECMYQTAPELDNGTFRGDDCVDRKDTLEKLQRALLEYKQLLWVHSQLKGQPATSKHSQKSVETWLHNHQCPIKEPEADFVTAGDLISIAKRKSPLHDLFHQTSMFSWVPFLRDENKPMDFDSKTVGSYSDSRVDSFLDNVLLFLGMVMLIVPLWVLYLVQDIRNRLAFISGAIILFLMLIIGLTAAKPSEALAATAAYSAVLMVFIQIGT